MATRRKLVLIGLDAPVVERVEKFAAEGKMPNVARLIEEGVLAENCMVPLPTITPPNWTTIVTGAWPGTHGITCFNYHKPGDPLDRVSQAFDTSLNKAEYLWNAAERVGKRSIVFNYPSSWPSTLKNGVQVGGAGLGITEWRTGTECFSDIAAYQVFSIEGMPGTERVLQLREPSGWASAPPGGAMEATLEFEFRRAKAALEPVTWWALLLKGERGFERVAIYKSKSEATPLCMLRPFEWSETIVEEFRTAEGPRRAAFRICLDELAPDGDAMRLFFTALCALDGWSEPPEVAKELEGVEGLPLPDDAYLELRLQWMSKEAFVELQRLQLAWYAGAVERLMQRHEWDLFFMHAHTPDWLYHIVMRELDPLSTKAERQEEFAFIEERCYALLDEMIGRVLRAAGGEALVVIVSDHGATTTTARVNVSEILAEAGLLHGEKDEHNRIKPDWSRTKAWPQRSCYIYLNVKGRDPGGIVEPGEEYEQVRNKAIEALMNYTDPESGLKPFTLVLRKEDARILGLYGDYVGDIVYSVREEFGGEHGQQLPTAKLGLGSMRGLLILSGPGVKKGERLQRTAWLTDVVPTVCHLLELPVPAQAEGAILYQALADPDEKRQELLKLRERYEKTKGALEAKEHLEHRY